MNSVRVVWLSYLILGGWWGKVYVTNGNTDTTETDEVNELRRASVWCAHYLGDVDDLNFLLSDFKFYVSRELVENWYIVGTLLRFSRGLSIEELERGDPNVPSTHNSVPSMNVDKVWASGFTGKGVTVAVIDDGIDTTHTDLADNYKSTLSYNYITNSANPSHDSDSVGHGTWCAGTIAASANDDCITGVAYDADIIAVKIVDVDYGQTELHEAYSLIHRLDIVDIYMYGWGPEDNGVSISALDAISDIATTAMHTGITEGRDGKGAIYVWAAGNGGKNFDDCNVDGFVNSIYTIAVTALKSNGELDDDAEGCAAVMASVFASGIPTTAKGDQCITSFAGSSAAAATASGIIALVLEANPDLTWRDVQHIIVESAVEVPRTITDFTVNGAGKIFSSTYGFGAMDAEAMVNAALNWELVDPMLEFFGPIVTPDGTGLKGVGSLSSSYDLADCPFNKIEHVVVYISFRSDWREYTSIYLKSPSNTDSRLLRQRNNDYAYADVTWYFSSLAFWGENPNGTWTLRMDSTSADNDINILQWKLSISGTYDPVPNSTVSGPTGYVIKEITETDVPMIVGACLGAALGFVLLVLSCVCIIKATAEEITKNEVTNIETVQEELKEGVEEEEENFDKMNKTKMAKEMCDSVKHTKLAKETFENVKHAKLANEKFANVHSNKMGKESFGKVRNIKTGIVNNAKLKLHH